MVTQIKYDVPGDDRYRKLLAVVSSILPVPLTMREIDILGKLYQLQGPREMNTENRRMIRETLNISEQNLNNHIRQLTTKGVLRDNEVIERLDLHMPPKGSFDLVFSFNIQ